MLVGWRYYLSVEEGAPSGERETLKSPIPAHDEKCSVDRKCFLYKPSFPIRVTGQEFGVMTPENYRELCALYREQAGTKATDFGLLAMFGVCPQGLISTEAWELYAAYQATGGLSRLRTLKEYAEQPALWVAIVRLIESEMSRLSRADKRGRKA